MQYTPSPVAVKRANGVFIYFKSLQPYVLLKPESLTRRDVPWGGSEKQYFQKIKFVINSKILNLVLLRMRTLQEF